MGSAARRRGLFVMSSLALAVSAGQAFAGGFEKATMWDARYTALAGAAVSSVNNSSAIFYNPAGLAFAEANDVSLHFSPTITKLTAPAAGPDTSVKSEKSFVPNAAGTMLVQLNDQFTMGFGIYGAGGAAAKYKDVTVGERGTGILGNEIDRRVTGNYSTDIKIIEAGLALAYQINNNWSVGGTYRLTYAYADINMLSEADIPIIGGPKAGGYVGYEDMTGWNTFGVRLGAMYRSDDGRLGWGINYRSEVSVEADGKGFYENGLGVDEYDKRKATAETALPMQISTGVDYQLTPDWTLFGEVTYSEYSSIDEIRFKPDGHNDELKITHIYSNWDDQYNFRVAGEYTGIDGWALRGGYIYTTAVTPEKYATPTFSTAAPAHTITFGAGTTIMNGQVDLDFGAEYNLARNSSVKGGGEITNDGSTGPSISPGGKYKSEAYALHMTARYRF